MQNNLNINRSRQEVGYSLFVMNKRGTWQASRAQFCVLYVWDYPIPFF